MLKALESTKLKYRKHSSEHRELLVKSCPVKAHIPAWVNERVEEFMVMFLVANLRLIILAFSVILWPLYLFYSCVLAQSNIS